MKLPSISRLFARRRDKDSPSVLLISGFGWSGSGAVVDFAMDFHGVASLRKRAEETSLLKGRYSLGPVYRRVFSGEPVAFADIEQVASVFRGLPGSADSVDPRPEYINLKRNEQMRHEFGAERVDAAVDRFLEDCRKLSDGDGEYFVGGPEDLMRIGRRLTAALRQISVDVRLKETPSHMIINNDPAAYSMDLFPFHENALYTVVTRDLRDVFADLLAQGRTGDTPAEVNRFCSAHVRKLKRFAKTYRASARMIVKNTFVVDFEEFVSDENVRRRWKRFAGIDASPHSKNFDPSLSVGNIGIGRRLSEQVRDTIRRKAESVRNTVFDGIHS